MSLHFKQKFMQWIQIHSAKDCPVNLQKPTQWWKTTTLRTAKERKHILYFIYYFCFIWKFKKSCIYISVFHPGNIYCVITLFSQCVRCWVYSGEKGWILCPHGTESSEKTHSKHTKVQRHEEFRGRNVIGTRPRGLSSKWSLQDKHILFTLSRPFLLPTHTKWFGKYNSHLY